MRPMTIEALEDKLEPRLFNMEERLAALENEMAVLTVKTGHIEETLKEIRADFRWMFGIQATLIVALTIALIAAMPK